MKNKVQAKKSNDYTKRFYAPFGEAMEQLEDLVKQAKEIQRKYGGKEK